MILDSHAHVNMPPESYKYFSELVGGRANPTVSPKIGDAAVRASAEATIKMMDSVGTDVQLISPRPYIQMHSIKPGAVTEHWTRYVNNLIARQVELFPDRLKGVAGLPQHMLESPAQRCVAELERCVKQLGFVGTLINPDPTEGDGAPPPGMGDRFWYPLYEKMVELDVPALVHSASSCQPRESYTLKFINEESIAVVSMLESTVFEDFPTLKMVISHGGGAIPYQMGRFRAWAVRRGEKVSFDDKLKKLNFDTCIYSKESIEFLIRTVGVDNVLFGTEKPGTGSAPNPETGRDFDDLKPVIESIDWLSRKDREAIFTCNCAKLYRLNYAPRKA